MNKAAKGKIWEREAREILERLGYKIEPAINKTVWIGPGKIISVAHDFFTCWDGLGCRPPDILFYQVGSWEDLSHKIKKINGAGVDWKALPCQTLILCRIKNQRPPHFRLCWGEDDYRWMGQVEIVRTRILNRP